MPDDVFMELSEAPIVSSFNRADNEKLKTERDETPKRGDRHSPRYRQGRDRREKRRDCRPYEGYSYSYEDDCRIQRREPETLFERHSRFFIIKSFNADNLLISQQHGVWATNKESERKLDKAFKNEYRDRVYLIFSVNKSGGYQGYAEMVSCVGDGPIVKWKEFTVSATSNFCVKWKSTEKLPFADVRELKNPKNFNMPVKIAFNGTELPFDVGSKICFMLQNRKEE